jgi:hypothetical protein
MRDLPAEAKLHAQAARVQALGRDQELGVARGLRGVPRYCCCMALARWADASASAGGLISIDTFATSPLNRNGSW